MRRRERRGRLGSARAGRPAGGDRWLARAAQPARGAAPSCAHGYRSGEPEKPLESSSGSYTRRSGAHDDTSQEGDLMSDYAVARLDEIDEITDGRVPLRPVRHHFGITSFGVNAWTGREAGDRIINEHDEEGEDEELYLVHSGRATFELDGERGGRAGRHVRLRAPGREADGVRRGARDDDPRARRHARARRTSRAAGSSGRRCGRSTRRERYAEAADRRLAGWSRRTPQYADALLQPRLLSRASPGRTDRRDRASAARDRARGAVPGVRPGGLGLRRDP